MVAPRMEHYLPAAAVDMTARAGKRYVMIAIAFDSSYDTMYENQQLVAKLG